MPCRRAARPGSLRRRWHHVVLFWHYGDFGGNGNGCDSTETDAKDRSESGCKNFRGMTRSRVYENI